MSRRNQQSGMCIMRRLKSGWPYAQSEYLRWRYGRSLDPQLPFTRTAKTLVRLDGSSGWSESSRGAHVTLLALSCRDSYVACARMTKSELRGLIILIVYHMTPNCHIVGSYMMWLNYQLARAIKGFWAESQITLLSDNSAAAHHHINQTWSVPQSKACSVPHINTPWVEHVFRVQMIAIDYFIDKADYLLHYYYLPPRK